MISMRRIALWIAVIVSLPLTTAEADDSLKGLKPFLQKDPQTNCLI